MIADRRFGLWGACSLLIAGATAICFREMIFGGRIPVFRDVLDTTLPLGSYIGARLREGSLPQWFPWEGLGEPFIGQLNESTFHPSSWLYAVLSPAGALRLQVLLAYLAGGFGQVLFGRKLGLSFPAAALAAIAFIFSGYALSMSNLIPYLWGMATLPWLGFLASHVCTSERPWPWVAGLSLCWSTVVLAGDSHSALFGGLVALFAAVQAGRIRRLLHCLAAAGIAIALSAVELLPAIDVVRAGPRVAWSDVGMLSSRWALHGYRLPSLLLPRWMPLATTYLFANLRFHDGGVWALSVYPGTPVVGLALVALAGRSRTGLLAAALALLMLWLSAGSGGGLEPAVRRLLPIFNILRYPEKHLGLFTVALPLAAGAGLDWVTEKPRRAVPIAFAAAAAFCALVAGSLPADAALRIWPRLSSTPGDVGWLYDAWRSAFLAAALSLAATAGVLAICRSRPGARWLLTPLIFADLLAANQDVIGLGDASLLEGTPRFCAAARARGAGPSGQRALNVSSRPRRLEEAEDGDVWAAISRNQLLPGANSLCGIAAFGSNRGLSNEPRAVRALLDAPPPAGPATALFGFGFVVRAFPEDRPVPGENVLEAMEVAPGKELLLVERPAAPRAWAAVPHWVPDADAASREVRERGLALVDSPALTGTGPVFAGSGKAGEVRIAQYRPESVVLEARMSRAGAVILNDLAADGWTATLDGKGVPIHPANALVRGVIVPAGDHRIEMSYRLPRLPAGLGVSATALLLCGVLLARTRRMAGA